MKMIHALAGAAAAAMMIAAPLSIAQTQPATPPAATQPATPPTPTAPAAPAATPAPAAPANPNPVSPTPTAPAAPAATPAPAAPANPNPVSPTSPPDRVATSAGASTAAPVGCRTRKAEGEACACLSDTTRIGTSTAHADGHNVCVRPD